MTPPGIFVVLALILAAVTLVIAIVPDLSVRLSLIAVGFGLFSVAVSESIVRDCIQLSFRHATQTWTVVDVVSATEAVVQTTVTDANKHDVVLEAKLSLPLENYEWVVTNITVGKPSREKRPASSVALLYGAPQVPTTTSK